MWLWRSVANRDANPRSAQEASPSIVSIRNSVQNALHIGADLNAPNAAAAYRRTVLEAHPEEFRIHHEVAALLEAAVLEVREHPTLVHIVTDMLMLQSMKSHAAISLLCQHGLMEDSATLARRLLELSIQAVYIGAETEEKTRRQRAGAYLAYLWRQLPRRIKQRLPDLIRARWTSIGRGYGRHVRRGAVRWGPRFITMFEEVGSGDLYRSDYAFLSAIAHGSADSQVFDFSADAVRIHRHDFVPVLLIYSSRYYLVTAQQWQREFGIVDAAELERLSGEVLRWQPG